MSDLAKNKKVKIYLRFKVNYDSRKEMFVAKSKISKRFNSIDIPENMKHKFIADNICDLEFDIKNHFELDSLYKRKREWVFT